MMPIVLLGSAALGWLLWSRRPVTSSSASFGASPEGREPMIVVPDAPPPGIVPVFAPSEPLPASPLPGVIPIMMPRPISERRALATQIARHLSLTPPGRESKALIQTFQAREGIRPSGYYGPQCAIVLARSYGIVPPKPLYWTKTDTKRAKQAYRDALLDLAARDPQRAEEWQRASEV
jgi:hypothetical protein